MKLLVIIFFLGCSEREAGFQFALVSDTHIGSETAADDLEKTIEDINQNEEISFVVITGDITEMGSDEELISAESLLSKLEKPWYVMPGNHDTKWSESGNESFKEVFGYERFAFQHGDYLFIGCSSGPNMRMAPGLVPREDILWLDSVVTASAKKNTPIIFFNHYPLDEGLANWYSVIDILKKGNIKAAICGHGHRNKGYNFEGIPGLMSRSNLTTSKDTTGYNIVTIEGDSLAAVERISGLHTHRTWRSISMKDSLAVDEKFDRPSYQVNQEFNFVQEVWQVQDSSNIGSGMTISEDQLFYNNTAGYVKSLDIQQGKLNWAYKTGGKIYATPASQDSVIVTASTDGNIYAINASSGKRLWTFNTQKSIVASPIIDDSVVYCGGSDGVFRAINLRTGSLVWQNNEISGFVETVPAIDSNHIYFGDWGNHFQALDKSTGEISWQWSSDKGRLYAPAACEPVLAEGKVFVVAPDRHTTAFDVNTGAVVWRNNQHKGRESIGLSVDKSLVYIKDMQDSLHAFYTQPDSMVLAWSVSCGFGYEISPSPIVENDGLILIPTQWGTVFAVDRDSRKVVWQHKLSHAIITGIVPVDAGSIIVSTMDGKITKLTYKQLI